MAQNEIQISLTYNDTNDISAMLWMKWEFFFQLVGFHALKTTWDIVMYKLFTNQSCDSNFS